MYIYGTRWAFARRVRSCVCAYETPTCIRLSMGVLKHHVSCICNVHIAWESVAIAEYPTFLQYICIVCKYCFPLFHSVRKVIRKLLNKCIKYYLRTWQIDKQYQSGAVCRGDKRNIQQHTTHTHTNCPAVTKRGRNSERESHNREKQRRQNKKIKIAKNNNKTDKHDRLRNL